MDKILDQKDAELVSVLKKVENITFEYSSDNDFKVKLYILKLIISNQKKLRNIRKIEFDYIKTAEELEIIHQFNQQLKALNFPTFIETKLMSKLITTGTLDSIFEKSHQINKFFFTIDHRKMVEVDF